MAVILDTEKSRMTLWILQTATANS